MILLETEQDRGQKEAADIRLETLDTAKSQSLLAKCTNTMHHPQMLHLTSSQKRLKLLLG